jgi:hypothetical protein
VPGRALGLKQALQPSLTHALTSQDLRVMFLRILAAEGMPFLSEHYEINMPTRSPPFC